MTKGRATLVFTSGYLFGRGHKRSALVLAGLAAGKQLRSCRPPGGLGRLGSSELGKLGNQVGRQLVSAGRSAAMSAASHRIDALSDRMERRASMLRSGSEGHEEQGEEREEREEEAASRRSGGEERRAGQRRTAERRTAERRGTKPPRKSADRPARGQKRTAGGGPGRRAEGDE